MAHIETKAWPCMADTMDRLRRTVESGRGIHRGDNLCHVRLSDLCVLLEYWDGLDPEVRDAQVKQHPPLPFADDGRKVE